MDDNQDDLKKQLEAHKPKKKKLAVPEGFLDDVKSYEGKLEAVKIIAEREKNRVLLMFKKLLEPELPPPQKRIEPTLEPLKPKVAPKKKK